MLLIQHAVILYEVIIEGGGAKATVHALLIMGWHFTNAKYSHEIVNLAQNQNPLD